MDSLWLQNVVDGFAMMSGWEVVAAILGLGYIIFAARESQWCWPMAFLSTLIYTALFWEGQLPTQAMLNFYYMGMAVYGYWLWQMHETQQENLAISNWPWQKQISFILLGIVISQLTGNYLYSTAASQSPYLEAHITVFSVMNTWLMARKVIQNWLYWIVIDAAAVVLYWQTGFYATVVLFSVYTVLAIVGYANWLKLYAAQQNATQTA